MNVRRNFLFYSHYRGRNCLKLLVWTLIAAMLHKFNWNKSTNKVEKEMIIVLLRFRSIWPEICKNFIIFQSNKWKRSLFLSHKIILFFSFLLSFSLVIIECCVAVSFLVFFFILFISQIDVQHRHIQCFIW